MTVRIQLFAGARELAGRDELAIDVPVGATIADVRRVVAAEYPALTMLLPHSFWAVDTEYATQSTPLTEQSAVALIPPVSGG